MESAYSAKEDEVTPQQTTLLNVELYNFEFSAAFFVCLRYTFFIIIKLVVLCCPTAPIDKKRL